MDLSRAKPWPHGYLSRALGGVEAHAGAWLGGGAVIPPADQQHHAHLLYPRGVPTLHQPGFTALAAASWTAARGIVEHGRPHGAPVGRLVLTFSPGAAR